LEEEAVEEEALDLLPSWRRGCQGEEMAVMILEVRPPS
jgi:hypothetical protein